MKKEIIEHVKNLKEQGANVKVDEDQINDLINKILDKKYEKYEEKTRTKFEIDKFLEKYEYTNIYVRYNKNKNKFDTEKMTKSLKKLHNEFINLDKFNEEYNKFMDDFKNLNIINPKKSQVVFLKTKKK